MEVKACCAAVRVTRVGPIRRIRFTRLTLSRFLIALPWIVVSWIWYWVAVSSTHKVRDFSHSSHRKDGSANFRSCYTERRRHWHCLFPRRVLQVRRSVLNIRVQIEIAAIEIQRILADESLRAWAIVTSSVVVEVCAISFSAGELVRIRACLSGRCRTAERIV